jgi:hypothetical protein
VTETLASYLKGCDEKKWKEKEKEGLFIVKHFESDDLLKLIRWAKEQGYFLDKGVPAKPLRIDICGVAWFEFYDRVKGEDS